MYSKSLPVITVADALEMYCRAAHLDIRPVGDVDVRVEVRTQTREFRYKAVLRYVGEGEYKLVCPTCGRLADHVRVLTENLLTCSNLQCFVDIILHKAIDDTKGGSHAE